MDEIPILSVDESLCDEGRASLTWVGQYEYHIRLGIKPFNLT